MRKKDCYILAKTDKFLLDDNGSIQLLEEGFQPRFKLQTIVNGYGSPIGYEVLLDFQYALENNQLMKYKTSVVYGESLLPCIQLLHNFFREGSNKELYVFINIERSNLCDVRAIKKIDDLSKYLKSVNVTLVVEITEREYCKDCCSAVDGLLYLSANKLLLAADDFNYIDDLDHRYEELLSGIYNIVKISVPLSKDEELCLSLFLNIIKSLDIKIIVERVENIEQWDSMRKFFNEDVEVLGYQGFLFCNGVSLAPLSVI
ncbi:EAL domain-containing protein [Shewanella algae]|uniref:EAL domain-containing protein n=1 Tax=Shewanella algae TaxID=38313 RepID=UPI001AADECFD|nr:EAL domain-containing protein [Shewanella algae]MBO2656085.1 EAL domain-containing protein [Shewanella algae]